MKQNDTPIGSMVRGMINGKMKKAPPKEKAPPPKNREQDHFRG